MAKKIPKYKPAWNVEFYQVVDKGQVILEETEQSRQVIDLYSEIPDFMGIVVIFDNLNKIIWAWCSRYVKPRGWAKKLIKYVKKGKKQKFADFLLEVLKDEMEKDFSDYKVAMVTEGQHPNEFEELFLYDVVDINLYKKHYYKPEYQHLYNYMEPEEEEPVTKKCKNCGWIMSSDKKVCPKCRKDPDIEE